jgi:NAD(P)-dependent dehydrogenase (short-subunit alcohol dehydrogenase family)
MNTISIVTGGSRGLGRNTATSIARRRGDVIITFRRGATGAQAVVADIEALGRKAAAPQLDVRDIRAFPAFVEKVRPTLNSWGRDSFNHLVNNTGHANGELR